MNIFQFNFLPDSYRMFGDTSETMLENGANSFKPGRKNEADDEDDLAINNLSTILTDADEDSLY